MSLHEQSSSTHTNNAIVGLSISDDALNNEPPKQQTIIQLPNSQPQFSSIEQIPIKSFQEHTTILQKVSKEQHVNIYDRATEFINLSKEDYSEDNLLIGTQLTNEFIVTGGKIVNSAVGLAAQCKIDQGRLMNKVLDIHDTVIGTGREDYADKMFPYPKSTRCMYIRIGTIAGVDSYTSLGTEFLRKVATAIEKTGVEGQDQIKALFEKFGEECDLSIGNKLFKAKLQGIIEKVLNYSKAVDRKESIEKPPILLEPEVQEEPSDEPADLSELGVQEQSSEEPADLSEPEVQEQSTEEPADLSEPEVQEQSSEESARKKCLNQESINKILAAFMTTVDDLLLLKPPTMGLDLILFERVKASLERLESYVKGGAVK